MHRHVRTDALLRLLHELEGTAYVNWKSQSLSDATRTGRVGCNVLAEGIPQEQVDAGPRDLPAGYTESIDETRKLGWAYCKAPEGECVRSQPRRMLAQSCASER